MVREKLSYANVMATVAVFITLGGVGYAASQLPKNSVKAKQIAKNAVKGPEIAANSVGTSEVTNGSLLSDDFGAGEIPAGPQGPAGNDGQPGATGPPGPTLGKTETIALPPAIEPLVLGAPVDAVTINLPTAGRLLVTADADGFGVVVDCDPNSGGTVGLYADGTIPIQGTSRTVSNGAAEPYHVSGVTDVLPAGSHQVGYGANCTGASIPEIFNVDTERSTSAVLLGSG